MFSPEFCSFIDDCLQKDADARPTAEQVRIKEGSVFLRKQLIIQGTYRFLIDMHNMQLLSHPFIKKYENATVDLAAFVRSIFDPTQRMKDLADVSCILFKCLLMIM